MGERNLEAQWLLLSVGKWRWAAKESSSCNDPFRVVTKCSSRLFRDAVDAPVMNIDDIIVSMRGINWIHLRLYKVTLLLLMTY